MSMGMERRWHAKMVFMRGMYCAVGGDERERRKMRDVRGLLGFIDEEEELKVGSGGVAREDTPPERLFERRVVCLLM